MHRPVSCVLCKPSRRRYRRRAWLFKERRTLAGIRPTLNQSLEHIRYRTAAANSKEMAVYSILRPRCRRTTKRCFLRETAMTPALLERSEGSILGDSLSFFALCFVHIQILTRSAAHKHAQSNKRASVRPGSMHIFLSQRRQRELFSLAVFG